MSGNSDSKWKDKYLRNLDELEEKERRWAEAEDLLRRAVGRLAHTGYGLDPSLDRQLDRVRDAVRGKRDPHALDRLVRDAGDTAAKAQEESKQANNETGQAMASLLDGLALSGAQKKRAAKLRKELLAKDAANRMPSLLRQTLDLLGGQSHPPAPAPASANTQTPESKPAKEEKSSGGFLSRMLGKKPEPAPAPPPIPAQEPNTPANGRLLESLLARVEAGKPWNERIAELKQQAASCRGERESMRLLEDSAALLSEIASAAEGNDPNAQAAIETLPSAGEALLGLLEKIEIPAHLQERLGVIKNAVVRASTQAKARNAVQAIADLLGDIRREVQKEKLELEQFLEGVTNRIQTLSEHVIDLGSNRDSSSDSRCEFEQSFQDHMDGIRTSIRDETDITSLKAAIESGLDAIENQMGRYVEREEELTREAKEQIEDLSGRLHDMKNEAFLLQKKMQEQRNLALKDPLTGAFNRLAYNERIANEHERWSRYGAPLSLLVLDIDHFKRINDTFGHLAGDKALKALAARLLQNVREVDIVARYGGEEFVVIMPNTPGDQAYRVAEKLRSMVATAGFHYRKQPVNLTISLGVASFREGDDAESVFNRADKALYGAKQSGRNRTHREGETAESVH